MRWTRPRSLAALGVVVLVVGALAYGTGAVVPFESGDRSPVTTSGSGDRSTSESDDRPTVTVHDEDGARLATVRVEVADTAVARYTGLSRAESLTDGEGMLFVHEREDTYAYVMREMDFPLDIVFVAADGTVTRVHHAPLPPPDTPNRDLTRYRGRGKYVLEVPYGYTDRTGIEPGDRVVVPEGY